MKSRKLIDEYMKQVKDVDENIALSPKGLQYKLKELEIIKSAAPKAQEHISYGMAYYHYKGLLVYFGLYIPTPIIEEHKSELKGYETTKATIRFPLDKRLPAMLIKKLVKARINKINELDKKK